jgi:hypothetical protein
VVALSIWVGMAHATFLSLLVMLKVELTQYPISIEVIDDLVVFMIYHSLETLEQLTAINDEDLEKMEGYQPVFREVVHLIRGMALN